MIDGRVSTLPPHLCTYTCDRCSRTIKSRRAFENHTRACAPIMDRIAKTISVNANGCWVWLGARGKGFKIRYGHLNSNGKTLLAHRVVYESLVGPIPVGMTLDHLCRNRVCVNPVHLEPVTSRTNTLRGSSMAAENAKKHHCKNGHQFSSTNTYVRKRTGGGRVCRKCDALRMRKKRGVIWAPSAGRT